MTTEKPKSDSVDPQDVRGLRQLRLPLCLALLLNIGLLAQVPFAEHLGGESSTAVARASTRQAATHPADTATTQPADSAPGAGWLWPFERPTVVKDPVSGATSSPSAAAVAADTPKASGAKTGSQTRNLEPQATVAAPTTNKEPTQPSGSADAPPAKADPPALVLANSSESPVPFHFVLDDQVMTLAPGETLRLPVSGPRKLQFHRGGEFGEAERELESGEFEFRVTRQGWRLLSTGSAER